VAEIITLTSPVPSITNYRVAELRLNWAAGHIHVGLLGPNNETATCEYSGAAATALMTALNKANLTSNSLHRRVLSQLVSDGKLAGTISGIPD